MLTEILIQNIFDHTDEFGFKSLSLYSHRTIYRKMEINREIKYGQSRTKITKHTQVAEK